MSDFESLHCPYALSCSGCAWIALPYREQLARKRDHLVTALTEAGLAANQLPEIEYRAIAAGGLRDRADLVIDQREGDYRTGLYGHDHHSVVDLDSCAQMSPALASWYQEFRRFRFPIKRGSVRLRVSPQGAKGVWLDLANVDVKTLLDEGTLLRQLKKLAFVEIGQRRKHLTEVDGVLKLRDPQPRRWFETYLDPEETAVPLACTVGGFTQPGFMANRVLVRAVRDVIQDSGAKKFVEFGSGIGNFTLPLASLGEQVIACEMDELACESLEQSASQQGLSDKIKILRGNFQFAKNDHLPKGLTINAASCDAVVVDPPRSGLKQFLDPLFALNHSERPSLFVYVSCFAESFAADVKRLQDHGYALKHLTIVDQFPQSPHYEIVSLLRLE